MADGKLTSMKRSKAEAKEYAQPMADNDAPSYPWGLCINLDNDSLEKLGLEKMPAAGDELMLVARVEVTGVNVSDTIGGGESKSLSLQITDMDLGPEATDVSDKFYKKGKK